MKYRPHIAFLLALAAPLAAQSRPDSSLAAVRLAPGMRAPVLDGRLDDAAWKSARPVDDLRQREPLEGGAPTERTEVRVLFDNETLYIGIHAFDSEPDKVVARILDRDRIMFAAMDNNAPEFGGDDAVAILVDGFRDHRNATVFATNANGAEFDALLTDEGREFNVDWRGIWRVASTRTADGWSTEFAIPFRSLRYNPAGGEWGINVYRMIRRKNEEVLWRGWTRSGGGFARVSLAGALTGLGQLPAPGKNIEVRPYVLLGTDRERNSDTDRLEDTRRRGLGGEIKLQPRAGLVFDGTVNTDFAQVEADNQQVNLTRFSLFFPEKREFFLENAGIFEFGARGRYEPPPFLMFFSRRIGIANDGPVPVLGGGRLTGRVGGQTIGLLSMATDSAFDQGRTMFNVARVKRDIGGNNYVGAMVTDRRSSGAANTVGGVDFSAWPLRILNVQGFAATTTTKGPGGDGMAGSLSADMQTGRYGVNVRHVRVGRDADAQMGFVTRTDLQQTNGQFRLTFRPNRWGIRTASLMDFSGYAARMDGTMQDWRASAFGELVFNSGTGISAYHRFAGANIDEEFKLADSVTVPVGNYKASMDGFFANTNPALPVTLNVSGEKQYIYGGVLSRMNGTLVGRLGSHLALDASVARNWVNIPTGAFTADLIGLRASVAVTTRLFINALAQYNGLQRNTSGNFRLQYIFAPGSDIYVVYNEARGDDLSTSRLMSRGMRLKVAYLRRF